VIDVFLIGLCKKINVSMDARLSRKSGIKMKGNSCLNVANAKIIEQENKTSIWKHLQLESVKPVPKTV